MALLQVVKPSQLKNFVKKGKILIVKGGEGEPDDNLGAVYDVEVRKKAIYWLSSRRSGLEFERIFDMRRVDLGDAGVVMEVDLDTLDVITIQFRDPITLEEQDELKEFKNYSERPMFPTLVKSAEQILKDSNPLKRDQKFYFSFWTSYQPSLGLYPKGVVVASEHSLEFASIPGNESAAVLWNRGLVASGDPVADLKRISRHAGYESFSEPQPLQAASVLDAREQALNKAKSAKYKIDKLAKDQFLVA